MHAAIQPILWRVSALALVPRSSRGEHKSGKDYVSLVRDTLEHRVTGTRPFSSISDARPRTASEIASTLAPLCRACGYVRRRRVCAAPWILIPPSCDCDTSLVSQRSHRAHTKLDSGRPRHRSAPTTKNTLTEHEWAQADPSTRLCHLRPHSTDGMPAEESRWRAYRRVGNDGLSSTRVRLGGARQRWRRYHAPSER
ncbi:hypothetical protein C8Q76DRAFT_442638 [Earliella scabrosa]|nr:hypothetical protein C8Q76DRAFT_442638 [Earliella scabrosa]